MLKCDEPIITARVTHYYNLLTSYFILNLYLAYTYINLQMVDFLLQEGVCESLLGFITLVGTGQGRPTPADGQNETLKLSYK